MGFQYLPFQNPPIRLAEPTTSCTRYDPVEVTAGSVPQREEPTAFAGKAQNGWFMMEKPMKMIFFGGTPISGNLRMAKTENQHGEVMRIYGTRI